MTKNTEKLRNSLEASVIANLVQSNMQDEAAREVAKIREEGRREGLRIAGLGRIRMLVTRLRKTQKVPPFDIV